MSYRGGVVAKAEGLERARGLGLGRGVVEGIGVCSLWLVRGLLLLGRRGLRLVRGGRMSQHGQQADRALRQSSVY